MFDNLTSLALGIVVFAVVVVVGTVILGQFGATQAQCGTVTSCGTAATYNTTANTCSNTTAASCGTPTGAGYTNANYLATQLGSTSGGLASYAPLIIISVIGFVILGLFLGKSLGKKY